MIKAEHDGQGIWVFGEDWDEEIPGRADIRIDDSQQLAEFLESLIKYATELNWTGFGSPIYNLLATNP